MKRLLALAAVLLLAACAETPAEPAADFDPQMEVAVGTTGTWFFEGNAYSYDGSFTNGPASGKVTFTAGENVYGVLQTADVEFVVSINGVTITRSAVAPYGSIQTHSVPARLQLAAQIPPTFTTYMTLWVDLAAPAEITPTPPPLLTGTEYPPAVVQWEAGEILVTRLWAAPSAPQSKADCFKDGWKAFGFGNQGLCVKFVETGKDTR